MNVRDLAEESTITADHSEGAVDQIVGRIRTLIRDRALTIGDVLPAETELAQMFGASRNTVREAIGVLRSYGIVESRPSTGIVIIDRRSAAMMDAFALTIDISARSFHDIQGFRRLIEINLADELMSRPSADLLARLETINEAMRRANSAAEAAEIDYGFHRTLVDGVDNRTLSEVYRILRPVLRRLMEIGKAKRHAVDGAYNEHSRIVEALRRKDRLAYTFYMTQHLNAGLEFIEAPASGAGQRG